MNPKSRAESIFELVWGVCTRILWRVALWVGLAYFLYRVRSVLAAVLLAAVLTYAVLPVVDYLCSYRVRGMGRRAQRVTATILVFLLLISLGMSFTIMFLKPLGGELVGLRESVEASGTQLSEMKAKVSRWYGALPDDVRLFFSQQQLTRFVDGATKWSQDVLASTLKWLSHLLDLILIPVLAFYFALDARSLKHEFVGLVPRRRTREALAILHEINDIMRRYVIGQILLCVIAGFVVAAMLSLAGMNYVLILSIFAGITRAIPVIGPIVSGFVIVLLGVIQSPLTGLYLFLFFAFLHFAESKFIMPKLIGDRMQLHPAVILIVLLIGAEFFGLLGMFLAAPAAALARVLIRHYVIKPDTMHVWGLGRNHRGSAADSRTDDATDAEAA